MYSGRQNQLKDMLLMKYVPSLTKHIKTFKASDVLETSFRHLLDIHNVHDVNMVV